MPDPPGLEEMWRSAVAANLRYYEAWTRIASDWLRDLAGAGRGPQTPGAIAVRQASAPTAAPGPSTRSASDTAPGPALVLEAHAGEQVTGAFLVENQLGRPVETPMIADEITGPAGAVQPAPLE